MHKYTKDWMFFNVFFVNFTWFTVPWTIKRWWKVWTKGNDMLLWCQKWIVLVHKGRFGTFITLCIQIFPSFLVSICWPPIVWQSTTTSYHAWWPIAVSSFRRFKSFLQQFSTTSIFQWCCWRAQRRRRGGCACEESLETEEAAGERWEHWSGGPEARGGWFTLLIKFQIERVLRLANSRVLVPLFF